MLERINYRGWQKAYKLSNGHVELIVLADIGPRIIWYGFSGGENELYEVAADAGSTGGKQFRLYGGHRLWISPEVESTYYPDNEEAQVEASTDRICCVANPENAAPGNNLQKEMEVKLAPSGSQVTIVHRITNRGDRPAHVAPWTPTMMHAGGQAILPFSPRVAMDNDHLQPVGVLGIWSYTDFSDSRWILGSDFVQLKQSSAPTGRFEEQMSGLYNPAGWGAYFRAGHLFVKRAPVIEGAHYPDFGCNLEVFTNRDFLELETLGPLCEIAPGQVTSHVEGWWLFEGVPSGDGEEWIRSSIRSLVDTHTNLPSVSSP
jgi:hypothetical protein